MPCLALPCLPGDASKIISYEHLLGALGVQFAASPPGYFAKKLRLAEYMYTEGIRPTSV